MSHTKQNTSFHVLRSSFDSLGLGSSFCLSVCHRVIRTTRKTHRSLIMFGLIWLSSVFPIRIFEPSPPRFITSFVVQTTTVSLSLASTRCPNKTYICTYLQRWLRDDCNLLVQIVLTSRESIVFGKIQTGRPGSPDPGSSFPPRSEKRKEKNNWMKERKRENRTEQLKRK